ncbi:conserved hypothetical protein [Altererythrobacter sp. B11]|uniref:head-tail connector protein n=1 Tax=Altererythrobacter sp. B11 TaxID=2060312 RepID=UPI000DC730DF|nr:hypothetical protein [Altererythrobacter sp. B11]BBC71599.1 conserved hypothetical protein [Altererythrobacter sp. B11]
MKRAILEPPALAGVALDELKAWLAITTAHEDAALAALLATTLEVCEAYTGAMPLQARCEELIPAAARWQRLRTRPVQAIEAVEACAADGTRTPLPPADYEIDLDAEGGGLVRLLRAPTAPLLAVRFTAGLAAGWTALPEGLRHGMLRLAAHLFAARESDDPAALPPTTVAALWRPWRALRLA